LAFGGNMEKNTIKWKIMFFAIFFMILASIFEAATIPEIIAPTHPVILSFSLLLFDLIILLGTYNYAFRKKIVKNKIIWQSSLLLFYIVNTLALGFEFYNRSDGYEAYEMIHIIFFKTLIIGFMSYPTYLYYKNDLKII
jgi:hypothetical protein